MALALTAYTEKLPSSLVLQMALTTLMSQENFRGSMR